MERKTFGLSIESAEIKSSADGYSLEGWGSKFNGVDSYGDTILPGAFAAEVKRIKAEGRSPAMLFNHQRNSVPIGRWTAVSETPDGLRLQGTLTKGLQLAEDVRTALAAGTISGLSIGFGMQKTDYEWVDDPGSKITRIIKNVSRLHEVSVVTFPADDAARIDGIKSELDEVKTLSDLEHLLRDAAGMSRSTATAFVSRARDLILSESGVKKATAEDLRAAMAEAMRAVDLSKYLKL